MSEKLCANCAWFDESDTERLDGLCRAMTPVMKGLLMPGGFYPDEASKAVWPIVSADDYCGQHRRAPSRPSCDGPSSTAYDDSGYAKEPGQ